MKNLNEIKYSIGPGIRHAIIWLSIISSFAAGWYSHSQITKGELAAASLTLLEGDIIAKKKSNDKRGANMDNLEYKMEGKTYDKECGDRKLNDFYK